MRLNPYIEYRTARQTSIVWRCSEELVRRLCRQNRVSGARRVGRVWLIPEGTVKPPSL